MVCVSVEFACAICVQPYIKLNVSVLVCLENPFFTHRRNLLFVYVTYYDLVLAAAQFKVNRIHSRNRVRVLTVGHCLKARHRVVLSVARNLYGPDKVLDGCRYGLY